MKRVDYTNAIVVTHDGSGRINARAAARGVFRLDERADECSGVEACDGCGLDLNGSRPDDVSPVAPKRARVEGLEVVCAHCRRGHRIVKAPE